MPIYVVQKHAASTPHYDFRLEINNTLKSWVLPKGPTLDPHLKRLAIQTADHDLGFANFEGMIPEGHYGAGEIIIWDKGEFRNETCKKKTLIPLNEAYKEGKITFSLKGQKLNGMFTLLKIKGEKNWLLIKHQDEYSKENYDITKELSTSIG